MSKVLGMAAKHTIPSATSVDFDSLNLRVVAGWRVQTWL